MALDMLSPEAKLFIEFDYAETKDLAKAFITVVSGVLVFSLSFAEKIVRFENAVAATKATLVGSWVLFFLAIVLGGVGIMLIALAGSFAAYGGDYFWMEYRAHACLIGGGCLFVLGLASLSISAISSLPTR